MSKYQKMLSPVKINDVILKSRFYATKALPAFLQGPEIFPADPLIQYYANVARNGAAIVTCHSDMGPNRIKEMRIAQFDITDAGTQNYFSHLADVIHFHNSLASIPAGGRLQRGYNISEITQEQADAINAQGAYNFTPAQEAPVEMIHQMIQETAEKMKLYQSLGFDMCVIHMSYRGSIMACSLAPDLNHRTDQYGGSLENRARIILELCQAIKDVCGKNFLIEAQFSGVDLPGGFTTEDLGKVLCMANGLIDICHLRGYDGSSSHPTGFNSQKDHPFTLDICKQLKASGTTALIAGNGGYQDPELIEQWLEEGYIDMAAMGRTFIADFDYGQKLREGRGEDVIPCIRCNKCHHHVSYYDGPWICSCAVNPVLGIGNRLKSMTDPHPEPKRVAIVGGGPAGLRAAITACDRGHAVTIYEKASELGGQLIQAGTAPFKWPVRDYKEWLIRQVKKRDIDVKLGVEATPELLKNAGYDSIIAANGAVPKVTPIPGADLEHVMTAFSVYGNEDKVRGSVVIIGGSETGVETGIYLAELGHHVTVLTRQNELAHDGNRVHYYEMLRDRWQQSGNFHFILSAKTKKITKSGVFYEDENGNEIELIADTILLSGGMRPLQDEAMALSACAPGFTVVGDCAKPSDLCNATRTGFAAAMRI